MGYDATSGERNTTGQPRQTQALSFAGSTAKPHKASIMDEPTYISRMWLHTPHPCILQNHRLSAFGTDPSRWSLSGHPFVQPGRGSRFRTHGCCVPWLAVPATDLRSASWYSTSETQRLDPAKLFLLPVEPDIECDMTRIEISIRNVLRRRK